jgi:hypothetical protein
MRNIFKRLQSLKCITKNIVAQSKFTYLEGEYVLVLKILIQLEHPFWV